jgi:4'-phosphopantetheinyl transferase
LTGHATAVRGWAPKSDVGALELWYVDTQASGAALHALDQRVSLLSGSERRRAATFSDAAQAQEWLAAHIALRVVLERLLGSGVRGLSFERTKLGKPRLEGASAVFSLSHISGSALIALARGGIVGVDLERARTVRVREPRRARIEAAAAALNRREPLPAEGEPRFLQAWVRLEAFAKAEGCGVGRLLTRLGIGGERADRAQDLRARVDDVLAATPVAATCDVTLGEGLFAAVACGPHRAVPRLFRLPAEKRALKQLLA